MQKLLKNLDNQLEFLEAETEDVLEKAEEGVKISRKALEQLRLLILKQKFKHHQNEIDFFKNTKPQVYIKLFNIESKRPRSSNKSQIKYFNKHIDRLQDYFNDNLEFYHYYRRGATFLDEQYFLRGKGKHSVKYIRIIENI